MTDPTERDWWAAALEEANAKRDEWHRQNGHLRGERDQARAERDAATVRAEQAEADAARLREQLHDERAAAGRQQAVADAVRAELVTADARADAAEAALAELRGRLGEEREQWGVRMRDDDPAEDIEVMSSEAQARECATAWRGEIPGTNPIVMRRTERIVGQWRGADATPRTDQERAAEERGVQPVRSIDEFAAPEGERLSNEEWAAYAEALGIEPGYGEGGASPQTMLENIKTPDEQIVITGEKGGAGPGDDGRDHTLDMLGDDVPDGPPRAVAEYWHEAALACSNNGRNLEWTTVAHVTASILAAMNAEQPADPPLTERQAQLLAGIRKEGGDWSPARARDWLACLGHDVTPERGHQIMKALAERGLLEQVRPGAYTYRLKDGGGNE